MKTRFRVRLSLYLAIISISCSANATEYRIRDLGTLGWGSSWAVAINDTGQIVGNLQTWHTESRLQNHAFVWQNGEMRDLGTFEGYYSSNATDINNAGYAVGSSSTYMGGEQPFLWNGGPLQELDIAGNSGIRTLAINDSGHIVGHMQQDGVEHACLWNGSQMIDLGVGGRYSSIACGISKNGNVVGRTYSEMGSPSERSFLWQNGVMQDIGTLGGSCLAAAVNDQAQVVGSSGVGDRMHGFLWEGGLMIDMDSLIPTSINNRGQIVGSTDAPEGSRGFIWENGAMQTLGTLGGGYSWATDVNENGWIVGASTDALGQQHAVLWEPVPECSSLFSLMACVGGLGGLLRRRR